MIIGQFLKACDLHKVAMQLEYKQMQHVNAPYKQVGTSGHRSCALLAGQKTTNLALCCQQLKILIPFSATSFIT